MRARRMTQADVQGQISTMIPNLKRKDPPSAQTIRDWETADPYYPEWAVRHEIVPKDQLLSWALEELSLNGDEATMGQGPVIAASSKDQSLGKVLVQGAIFFGGLYVAGEILNAIFGPRNGVRSALRVNETPLKVLPRGMGRVRRKYHRPDEGETTGSFGLPPGHV